MTRTSLNALGILLLSFNLSAAEEQPSSREGDEVLEIPQRFEVRTIHETELVLKPRPILKWSNPVRGTTTGAVFLWTKNGRPAIALCAYPVSRSEGSTTDYEFLSVFADRVSFFKDGDIQWEPSRKGLEPQEIAHPFPESQGSRRRLQMRRLAGRFDAEITRKGFEAKLRLLPTPVYSYPADIRDANINSNRHGSKFRLVAGTMFAMVQGTDPEVLLIIEAWTNGDKSQFTYCLRRMTSVPLSVRYDGLEVWKPDWAIQQPSEPYFTVYSEDPWPE